MQELSVEAESIQSGGKEVALLTLVGYLDGDTAPHFMRAVQSALAGGVVCVVIDMSGLDYMSSAGFGVIAGTQHQLSDRAGKLVIAGLSEKLRTIFDTLGLSEIVAVVADREAAMEALN